MKLKYREVYINLVKPYIDKDIIKVFIGQRRVGKSYLMLQIIEEIKKTHQNANIIYINKEKYEFNHISDAASLNQYIQDHSVADQINYVFVDEIQEIHQFEKIYRTLYNNPAYDLYCTGSNANLLSSELATTLSGRYVEIYVHSLSFNEFMHFHHLDHSNETLLKYMKYGGLPYLINLQLNDDIVYDYLQNIFNSIILKDVVSRYNLRNVNFLERLIVFLAENTGQLLTAKRISDYLKSQQIKLSVNTIMNHLTYLRQAFFIHQANRYDIVGKKLFEINEKYYFEDLGLRHMIIGFKQVDIGKIIENIIYNHLLFCKYQVYVGKINNYEIDFVAKKKDQIIYIQACYYITDQSVIDREFGNLLKIPDNYRKLVISMDEFAEGNYKGIEHVHLLKFLTDFSG